MRSNLLRAVSHDLRTPLTSILGASSAILENDSVLTAKRTPYFAGRDTRRCRMARGYGGKSAYGYACRRGGGSEFE
ncbi:MAG: histidine kinase dimerization/phospho-acceptor domain-containing protein [Ruthenibacterium lactatiformans]